MNRTDCDNERLSSRTLGFIILPIALLIGLIGGLIVPVIGFLFSIPLLLLALVFIAAPESKVCKLIRGTAR